MTGGMNRLQANLCLLAVTLCWSCEVIIFSVIPDDVNPFATTCMTALIGAIMLGACFFRRIVEAFHRDGWLLARRLVMLSVINTTYNVLNLIGLNSFDVSTGAFTMSMVVVILPVMLLAMKRGVDACTWISGACVLTGIVIALHSSISLPQFNGLMVMGVSCCIRALYIVKLNDYAHSHDPVTLAAGMSAINALIAFVPWCAMEPRTFAALPWTTEVVAAYFIHAYFIVGFATVLNIFAQRRATPAQSTVIYSTEIVLSTIWATCLPASVIDPVDLTFPILAGCALIVAGNLVEIAPVGKRDNQAEDVIATQDEPIAQESEPSPVRSEGAPAGALDRIQNPPLRSAALFALLLAVYLVIALPFKVLSIIPGFTDIRPVCMLQPVYGIFFGLPGCFAFAIGNLIGDIASDSLRWSSVAGFIANFAYPYLMYLFWTKLRKKPFSLRGAKTLGLFMVTIVAFSILQTLIITPAVAYYYPDVNTTLLATSVLANDSLFPIGFAIPLIILMQEELGFCPVGRGRLLHE